MSKSKKRSKPLESEEKAQCPRTRPPSDDFEACFNHIRNKVKERRQASSRILSPERELARWTYIYGGSIYRKNLIHKLRDYVIARDGNNVPKGGDDVFKWVLNLLNPPGEQLLKVDAIRKIRVETNFAFENSISARYYLIFIALFRDGKNMDAAELQYFKKIKKSLRRA